MQDYLFFPWTKTHTSNWGLQGNHQLFKRNTDSVSIILILSYIFIFQLLSVFILQCFFSTYYVWHVKSVWGIDEFHQFLLESHLLSASQTARVDIINYRSVTGIVLCWKALLKQLISCLLLVPFSFPFLWHCLFTIIVLLILGAAQWLVCIILLAFSPSHPSFGVWRCYFCYQAIPTLIVCWGGFCLVSIKPLSVPNSWSLCLVCLQFGYSFTQGNYTILDYQRLESLGTSSDKKNENDLVVEVNLAAPYFVPGKKLYERVRWCLKDKLQLTFKFLMSWTNEGQQNPDTTVNVSHWV